MPRHFASIAVFAVFLPAVFLSFSPAVAAAERAHLIDGAFPAHSGEARAQLAEDLLKEIEALRTVLGGGAAAERTAVDSELMAVEALRDPVAVNARMQQLVRTPAYQQRQLRQTLDTLADALSCVRSAAGTAVRREMACWAVAAHHLSDRSAIDEAVTVLRKAGRLPSAGARRWNALGLHLGLYGRGIQENIVIPYLRGGSNLMQACRGPGC